MKIFTNYSFLFIAIIFTSEILASQETDYFRSKSSGYWHETGTWESSPDGLNWSDASLTPDHNSKKISIRNGHTISLVRSIIVDQLVVNDSAVLIVNGIQRKDTVRLNISDGPDEVDMKVYGKIIATGQAPKVSPFSVHAVGVISFEKGSVYEHNQNGGGIPFSRWQKGSTLLLNNITDTPPFNRAQDYSNIVVDLPGLLFNLNMGFRDNIISGDITILNTNQSRWVLVGPVTGSVRNVTILGNINQSGGNFTSHGTNNANSHAVINVFGDINVTGGNFSVVRGTQGGSGTTTWYLQGNLFLSDAVTQNANPTGAKLVFKGPEVKTLTLKNVTYDEGGLPIEVDGSSLNLGSTIIRGDGMFKLDPGSTLISSHEGGIDSSLQISGVMDLSDQASYIFSGVKPQSTGKKLPNIVNNLIINNESGVKLSKNVRVEDEINIVKGSLLLNNFNIILGSSAMLNETNGIVKGESGKITTTRNLRAPANLNVGGMGIVLTSRANLGSTIVERFHSPALVNGKNSISRQYFISPANNTNLNADVRMYYHESELDTLSEENLKLFSSIDGTENSWQQRGGTVNTEENYVQITGSNNFSFLTLAFSSGPVSVKDEFTEIPNDYSLYQNYPNPFNPETVIRFDLPEDSFVNLSVFNLIGEKVLTPINEKLNKGRHNKTVTAIDLPSGVYVYRLTSGDAIFSKKMILMK